ncbi:MAG: hypothetical protein HXY40_15660 [Chloroflexi bacterium]|nr:hypothetical protein [Chloroflexota bacterium]
MSEQQSEVQVRIEDRIRLMSAVLAATDWPDKAQERKPHGTHAHARLTRKYLAEFRSHEAVRAVQGLLDNGNTPLEALFALSLFLKWPDLTLENAPKWVPPQWDTHLRDFFHRSNLAKFWQDEHEVWDKSLKECRKMLAETHLKDFLKPFLGEITENLVFVPNISYPTDHEIGLRFGQELIVITPPWLAWGESPPWPFDENVAHIFGTIINQFSRHILVGQLRANAEKVAEVADANPLPLPDHFKVTHPTWAEQFTALFGLATTAMYLQDYISKREADSYLTIERKMHKLDILPGMISVLRRYVQELENGRYKTIIDFLPVFPKQLRVAKRIVSL